DASGVMAGLCCGDGLCFSLGVRSPIYSSRSRAISFPHGVDAPLAVVMSASKNKLSARDLRVKAALDTLIEVIPVDERLASDPVGMVHDYPPEEHEVVAHIAAVLAYGRVDLIRRAIDRVLQVLGPSPTEWVRNAARGD